MLQQICEQNQKLALLWQFENDDRTMAGSNPPFKFRSVIGETCERDSDDVEDWPVAGLFREVLKLDDFGM